MGDRIPRNQVEKKSFNKISGISFFHFPIWSPSMPNLRTYICHASVCQTLYLRNCFVLYVCCMLSS